MLCQTIKTGTECAFMSKKGCGFNGGSCHVIVEKCEGCNKVMEVASGKYCRVYPDPAAKWGMQLPSASHLKLKSRNRTRRSIPSRPPSAQTRNKRPFPFPLKRPMKSFPSSAFNP